MRRCTSRTLLVAVLCLMAWIGPTSEAPAADSGCGARAIGVDSQCIVNGVTLHFVDWGGHGPDLVLLTGLDDSARIFDEIAVLLSRNHRVIGVTRRGFCASGAISEGYDADTLAGDVIGFMKAAGITRADLVGHSMAGLELTRIAASHPELVRRLVYLDAATDKSPIINLVQKDPAGNRDPPSSASASFTDLTAWTQQLLKSKSPAIEANLRQCFVSKSGRLVARTPPQVDAAVLSTLATDRPDYSRIRAPALAIYSDTREADQMPPGASSGLRAATNAFSRDVMEPWHRLEKARFQIEIPCGRVIQAVGVRHYFFLEQPQQTATWIDAFLRSEHPCTWRPSGTAAENTRSN
jgi:pimeloyl-ACP methyl ester carboxylesterase